MRIKYNIILIVIIGFIFYSCSNSTVFNKEKELDNVVWNKDSTLLCLANIEDTISLYNIFINTKIEKQYKYSNMYIFINTKLPNNQVIHDTLEYFVVDSRGKFLGSGFGNKYSNKIIYRKHIKFPYKGIYEFEIIQAMRDDDLKHILSVGMRIEKVKR